MSCCKLDFTQGLLLYFFQGGFFLIQVKWFHHAVGQGANLCCFSSSSAIQSGSSVIPVQVSLGENRLNKTTEAIYRQQPALISWQNLNFDLTVLLNLSTLTGFLSRTDVCTGATSHYIFPRVGIPTPFRIKSPYQKIPTLLFLSNFLYSLLKVVN